ncbi:hypothetical protein DRW41_16055 [Neobacillus piezotolerans]|uniref:Uncharacterized protein n=1 Tax=Neobacillus piezotolerans TaxID=2259171 RepID=A0A3D8GMG1_9BACI|nr:hypothetical protein [Neobacillus piezotolerans]RDU35660.1 hypothetical protein DRW41_16055 [Neobacillus piezotolerans]
MGGIKMMMVSDKYRPSCRADFINLLRNKAFLKDCGELMNDLLKSDGFWAALERRLDFVMYTILQMDFLGGGLGESFLFRNFDSLTTDALFTMGEEAVKEKLPEPLTIIHDELFRQYVIVAARGTAEVRVEDYEFFVAPYFSGGGLFSEKPNGQHWMEELAEEIFRPALNSLIVEIRQRRNLKDI